MIQQLVQSIVDGGGAPDQAAADVLAADPMDLVAYMEQVWAEADLWSEGVPTSGARRLIWNAGRFSAFAPAASPAWDHAGYAYVLENTRAVQIIARVVREFRAGEALGIPQRATQRWLDATEVLLLGAPNLLQGWMSTSQARASAEAVRRGLYFRLFGAELAFGADDGSPAVFDKATAANTTFIPLLEELLSELWKAISNARNTSGENDADDDRIYRLAQQLGYMLRVRRQQGMLAREELAAATVLGWIHLTLSTNTPVVMDLRADASSAGDRLRLIGERVGLAPHSRASSFFAMAGELSILLRVLEAGYVSGPGTAWLLYATQPPSGAGALPPGARPLGEESRRVITEWSAATGKNLKVASRPQPVTLATAGR